MFKRLVCVFLFFIIVFGIWTMSAQPIFKDYASTYEIFLSSHSSSARIVSVTNNEYPYIKGIKGESCKIIANDFNVQDFLVEFSASVVFIEKIDEGTSYYAYSPKIKYREQIFGETVNLHVFVGDNSVTVGSPIIYGSF